MAQTYQQATFDQDIDCSNYSIIPGFCDAHTHPVFSGDRVHEFVMKIEGRSYMEIHQAGGGIMFTVDHVRNSSESHLLALLEPRLDNMMTMGTTLVEAKSGYGLDADTEIKMMKVLKQAHDKHPIDIVTNYCGAHAIPKGSNEKEATHDIIHH